MNRNTTTSKEETWSRLFDKAGSPPPNAWVIGSPNNDGLYDVNIRKSRFPVVDKNHQNRSVYVEGSVPGYTGHVPSLYVDPLFPNVEKFDAVKNSIPGYTGHVPGVTPENVLGATFEKTKDQAQEVLFAREQTRQMYQ